MINMTKRKPPTETYSYVAPKQIGICDKCGQPVTKLVTFKGKKFSTQREGIQWLQDYVADKLLKSGVIPEDALFSLTNRIVHRALRDGANKLPNRYVPDGKGDWKLVKGKFACIESADQQIKWAIKYPPSPISKTRFSLKAFTDSAFRS